MRIQLKYPTKVFPKKITKICDHDWYNIVDKAKNNISLKEIEQIQKIRNQTRGRNKTGKYWEMFAVRNKKGIKLMDAGDFK